VKSAIGFSAERGDQLSVQNIPFQDMGDTGAAETAAWWSSPFFMALYKNLLIGLGFLAMVMFVIRPLLKSLKVVKQPAFEAFEPIGEMPEKLSSAEKAQIAVQMAEQQSLVETAKKDPYQVAQILQNWLGEENN